MKGSSDTKKGYIVTGIACLLFTAGVFFVLSRRFDFYFSSNDDLLLKSIMNGSYSGTPDAHLVYIMYPLGLLFKALYTGFPGVIWYEIFTVAIHGISIFALTAAFAAILLKVFGDSAKGILFSLLGAFIFQLFILSIDIEFVFASQYTMLAGVIAAAAIACFLAEKRWASAVLLVLCFLLRSQVALMALPLMILVFILELKKDRAGIAKRMIPFAIALGLIIISFAADSRAYSGDKWRVYKIFNNERTRVYDYNLLPEYDTQQDAYDKLGISADEYTAMKEYELEAVSGLSADRLKALADTQQEILDSWKQYRYFIKAARDSVFALLENMKTPHGIAADISLIILFVTGLIGLIRKKDVVRFLVFLGTAAYYIAFVILFTHLGRLPERVLFGLDLMVIVFAAFAVMRDVENKTLLRVFCVITAVSSAAMMFVSVGKLREFEHYASIAEEPLNEIRQLAKNDPKSIYYLDTNVFEAVPGKMGTDENKDPANLVMMTDWLFASPLRSEKLDNLGTYGMFDYKCKKDRYVILSDRINSTWLSNILESREFSLEEAGKTDSTTIYRIITGRI